MQSGQDQHICQKRNGSTLAELCIVMALLAIVSTMIASFSAVMNKYVEQDQSQYTFIEDVTHIKQELSDWLSEMDEAGTTFEVTGGVIVAPEPAVAYFDPDAQSFVCSRRDGTADSVAVDTVTAVQFDVKSLSGTTAIVKCTVVGSDAYDNVYTQSFILTLRCGIFVEGGALG